MGKNAIFRSEDTVAIAVAIVLHVGLLAVLVLQPVEAEIMETPDRMAVSLASEVSLNSTAPVPVAESQASVAPVLADDPAPVTEPMEQQVVSRTNAPPVVARRNVSSPVSPQPPARSAPTRSKPQPRKSAAQPAKAATRSGGSRIGDDFLPGRGSSERTNTTTAPAATFGSSERAALASAISRQLRVHWSGPNGVDAEKLVSNVRWQLNKDGSLKGRPSCNTVSSSITDLNRPQAGLHCERAIRAVQLASPFNLPEQFYNQWDDLDWQFDRRL